MSRKPKQPLCAAREPLVYGSRRCEKESTEDSDLCSEHEPLIAPHRLIDGVFYVHRPEDE
jgi:hypothetical protein